MNQKKNHRKYSGDIFIHCLPLCIISPSSVIMEHSVLNNIGSFNESYPYCEDYDLWLRISLKYPIFFIDENLITKYGGHKDQLSRSSWGMDIYRVDSILNLLRSNTSLSRIQLQTAIQVCEKKITILLSGFKKRNNVAQYKKYNILLDECLSYKKALLK